MKYLKVFEDFERGASYPITDKIKAIALDYIKDNLPYILETEFINSIKTDGTTFFIEDSIYDNLQDVLRYGIFDYYSIENYTIKEDIVDIDGSVSIPTGTLTKIPVNFGEVKGVFNCSKNKLTSLIGCPYFVGSTFYCNNNNLTTLEYGPTSVGGSYICHSNQLISLKGFPNFFIGMFECYNNKLTSLEFSPEEVHGNFNCSHNELKSLKGGPKKVKGDYIFDYNENIKDFNDIASEISGEIFWYKGKEGMVRYNPTLSYSWPNGPTEEIKEKLKTIDFSKLSDDIKHKFRPRIIEREFY